MTELLDAKRLRQVAVNPFAEETERRIPVLCWTIDKTTQRPVAHWRLQSKPAPYHPDADNGPHGRPTLD
jgi:hypothetical protein